MMFNIDRSLFVVLLLIFYVPAIYRMAFLITFDTGLFNIFEWIRNKILSNRLDYEILLKDKTNKNRKQTYKKFKFWENLEEGINCTNCTGVWSAFILGIILAVSLYFDYAAIIIFALGGAGFQHYITNQREE